MDSAASSVSLDPIIAARYARLERITDDASDLRYLAQRLDTGTEVELQVLAGARASDQALVHALRRRAGRLAGLSDQAVTIATVLECEPTADGKLVLVMDHPRGPTLRDILKDTSRREGTLPMERVLHFALQIAEALESAHNLGLVHGGLRPENVVLTGPEPTISLARFGVDRLIASRSGGLAEKAASPYQAPEQVSGETTERSDIYALGAILYEMLAGTPRHAGDATRRHVEPDVLRSGRGEMSAGLESLIAQALQPLPALRPPNMSVVCKDLGDALDLHRRSKAPGWREKFRARGGMLRALFMGCVALSVIGALAVSFAHPRLTFVTSMLWNLRSESSPRPPTVTAPAALRASSGDPATERSVEPSRATGGGSAPRSRTPATREAGDGPRRADERQSLQPLRNTTSLPPAATTGVRSSDRIKSVQPRANIGATEPPRSAPPAARGPSATSQLREESEDPGAIIDWLLTESRHPRR
jgi:serine/threonine protein kinase